MQEIGAALIGGLFGGGLGAIFGYLQSQKTGRETWENWKRGGYGRILNLLDEYPSPVRPDLWPQAWRDARARVLLSGSAEVITLLNDETLQNPPPPAQDSSPSTLVDQTTYNELVKAMRQDVVPPPRWWHRRRRIAPRGTSKA